MDWRAIWDWIWADPIVRIPVVAAGVAILVTTLGVIERIFGLFGRLIGLFRKAARRGWRANTVISA